MACFLPRNPNDHHNPFSDALSRGSNAAGHANNLRSFGREIHSSNNIIVPDNRINQRAQSIKNGSTKGSSDLDANINDHDNGIKRNSPRKFSMHVKHSSSEVANQQPVKRFSSQLENKLPLRGEYNHHHQSQQQQMQQQQQQPLQFLKPADSREAENELNTMARKDAATPALVAQYSRQIFDYLRVRENQFKVGGYLERQTSINERMRSILVDWLVEAHKKFRLLPETLFMTVNIIDRYLDVATCAREKLQLVGVTALFISAKYEEIYPPPLKDFIELTQKGFSKADILAMEGNIVCALKFNLTVPSSLRFLERYGRVEKLDQRSSHMAQYLIELSLVEYKFVKYSESMKACAAIYLTNKLFKRSVCWSDATAVHSQHSEAQIRACALDLCMTLQNVPTAQTQAVKKKFLSPAFSEVATIQIEKINNIVGLVSNSSSSNNNNVNSSGQPTVNVVATFHPKTTASQQQQQQQSQQHRYPY